MHPLLSAAARRQHGLVTRTQCLLAGLSERSLRTLTRPGGDWVVVRRGAYVDRAVWDDLDETRRLGLHDRAAHLALGNAALLSHDSAARAWDLPTLRPHRELTHVTRFGVWGSRTEHGVKHHLTRQPVPAVDRQGLPATDLARTAVDLGREHGVPAGVVACDAALARGASRAEMEREVARMRSWPHVTEARAAVELARPGAESPGESLARLLVRELGAGEPETQFPVRLGDGRTAWADLRLGRLLVEFDGRVKYRGRDSGGLADAPADEVVWRERRREVLVESDGYVSSRVVWDDLFGVRRERALRRLARDLDRARAMYGDELTGEQATFVAAMADVRARRLARRWLPGTAA